MGEEERVIAELRDAGVLDGVRWAYLSARARTTELYSEADGHDATWLGTTRHIMFRDRLDRVFACERYAVSPGDEDADLDQLYGELSERDIDTMPRLAAGLVRRDGLNGSPGWAYGEKRFLLASFRYGELAFGRPRYNGDGGRSWHWNHDLLTMRPGTGSRRAPAPTEPEPQPDAPVRVRGATDQRGHDRDTG